MTVRCANPNAWCRTWYRTDEPGVYGVPDADRPTRGDVFAFEPVDLDNLGEYGRALWRARQEERYGAPAAG